MTSGFGFGAKFRVGARCYRYWQGKQPWPWGNEGKRPRRGSRQVALFSSDPTSPTCTQRRAERPNLCCALHSGLGTKRMYFALSGSLSGVNSCCARRLLLPLLPSSCTTASNAPRLLGAQLRWGEDLVNARKNGPACLCAETKLGQVGSFGGGEQTEGLIL